MPDVTSVKTRILIVEDDQLLGDSLARALKRADYAVLGAATGAEAISHVEERGIHLALIDMRLPDTDGVSLMNEIHSQEPDVPVIIMTAYGDVQVAVDAMKAGAADYLQKPFDLNELKIILARVLENVGMARRLDTFKRREESQSWDISGTSPQMQSIRELILVVADTPRTPVLITGESGTGKELVAGAIHRASSRCDAPLVKINVSAVPENLLESEFFGHRRGAFTDAKENKKGLFEIAHRGTLFLDEVGEMKPSLQPKLLRFLETQTFTQVGGTKEIQVDVRVIAATNRDLADLVRQGTFRDDLYYRLKVMGIDIPPLRERREDIEPLVERFLAEAVNELRKKVTGVTDEAREALLEYDWPGNVRELKNVIERAVILTKSGVIDLDHLPQDVVRGRRTGEVREYRSLLEVEQEHIQTVLSGVGGNRSEAARILGISRSTLLEKLKRFH
ncbi:MAG: sigma-54-dependent Fis family transcriptional regulator [Deltaproteobacteria bacterium]|nr:sigma-54-dependent Fis family transcriptional regulator [Candidatus Zymogenaceae bacterium]